jgi:Protein of unknown function (DUF3515)
MALTEQPPAPPEDPFRRAALLALAVLVPVVVAVVVLVNVLGGRSGQADHSGHDVPAEIEGSAPSERDDLPLLPLEAPPVSPEAEAACPALVSTLPFELLGEPSRRVDSDSPFVYAWAEPPVVLICGVERPGGWVAGVPAIQINGVQWHVDISDPETTVWTTVDRPVYVRVTVPASIDSAPVTALTTPIAEALPYQEPTPGQ